MSRRSNYSGRVPTQAFNWSSFVRWAIVAAALVGAFLWIATDRAFDWVGPLTGWIRDLWTS